jgi:hypothetical protein
MRSISYLVLGPSHAQQWDDMGGPVSLPVIPATQEADKEDRSSKPAQANSFRDTISKEKIGLVEWLKVKVLSSRPTMHPPKKVIWKNVL